MSVKEVAKVLDLSADTIYRMCRDEDLAHHRVHGTVKIASSDVDDYIERTRTERVAEADRVPAVKDELGPRRRHRTAAR